MTALSFRAALESGGWNAVVVRVIDGDTVRVRADLGFGVHSVQDIRLLDVSAPEITGAEKVQGIAAQGHLAHLLPVGSGVLLTHTDTRSFARYVGTLWSAERPGTSINEQMRVYLRSNP